MNVAGTKADGKQQSAEVKMAYVPPHRRMMCCRCGSPKISPNYRGRNPLCRTCRIGNPQPTDLIPRNTKVSLMYWTWIVSVLSCHYFRMTTKHSVVSHRFAGHFIRGCGRLENTVWVCWLIKASRSTRLMMKDFIPLTYNLNTSQTSRRSAITLID